MTGRTVASHQYHAASPGCLQHRRPPARRIIAGAKAFTLVELLVVIGIIALLVSILLPALSRAQQIAKQTSCLSNLKNMGNAMTMYLSENHNYYPGHCHQNSLGITYAIWPVRLRHYLNGDQQIFWCPAQPESYQWRITPNKKTLVTEPAQNEDAQYGYNNGEMLLDVFQIQFSYGINDWGTTGAFAPIPSQPQTQLGFGGDIAFPSENPQYHEVPSTKVRNSSEVIIITDKHSDGNWNFNIDPTDSTQCPYAIHSSGSNCLYADGHAEWHAEQDIVLFNVRTAPQYTNPASTTPATPYAKGSPQWNAVAPMWNNTNAP